MIDVSGLIGDIPPTTITVRTYAASTINAYGEAEAAATDTAGVVAVVHPSGRRELQRLGLDAKRETIAVYTAAGLGLSSTLRPPRVLYQTRWYEVVRVGDYLTLGGICLVHAALIEETA